MNREIKLKVVQKRIGSEKIELSGFERINKDGNWEYQRLGRDEYLLGTISDNTGEVQFRRLEFIGSKDEKGVDIYEGDIVLCTQNYHGKPTEIKFHAVIVYNEHIGAFQVSYNSIGGMSSDEFRWKYFVEVKGNIYENPELMS